MPKVGKKHYPYTPKGMAMAKAAAKKKGYAKAKAYAKKKGKKVDYKKGKKK